MHCNEQVGRLGRRKAWRVKTPVAAFWLSLVVVATTATATAAPAAAPSSRAVPTDTAAKVEVGSKLFKDPALSASGKMACATCHAEAHGHADLPGTGLPKGGAGLDLSGMRSSPTARYLNDNPTFHLDAQGRAFGGFTWDGRANSRQIQARAPFFSPVEMALPGSPDNPSALTDLVRAAAYYPELQALYPPQDIATDKGLFRRITELLEIYQRDDADYNLFDSKFDQVIAGTAQLTASERRGLDLFSDPRRGNCASCHQMTGKRPLFTNFAFVSLGAPRNHAGPLNADPSYFDLGLCAREKTPDRMVKGEPRYCGQFKTPTLRNVDRTAPYFHNASIATLEEAVLFHFQRDTPAAQRWYRDANGQPDVFYNDLPAQYQRFLPKGRPFNGAYQPSRRDLGDLLAFLRTLNDADQTQPQR